MPKFEYDSESGVLTRDGRPVGTKTKAGYLVLRYEGKTVYAHRLAWFLKNGKWPVLIDHINGCRSDNRICNLREVNRCGNAQNMIVRKNLQGAHFHKPSGYWKSAIHHNGRQIHLGYYPSAEHASEAYALAKSMFHPNWRGNHA